MVRYYRLATQGPHNITACGPTCDTWYDAMTLSTRIRNEDGTRKYTYCRPVRSNWHLGTAVYLPELIGPCAR